MVPVPQRRRCDRAHRLNCAIHRRSCHRVSACQARRVLRDVVELVLPSTCAGCGAYGEQCCRTCLTALGALRPRPASPSPVPESMPLTWAAAAYEGIVRRVIVAFKDHDRPDLGWILGPLVAGALREAIDASPQWCAAAEEWGRVAVIAVPSRAKGTRLRGRFPVGELVDHVVDAQRGPQPLLWRVDALSFGRAVRDQAGLDQRQRGENICGAMRLSGQAESGLRDVPIVLVDDITTTGSTLAEAARTVQGVAGGPMLAITVAATARHGTALVRL